jgi:hypothetical protein
MVVPAPIRLVLVAEGLISISDLDFVENISYWFLVNN